MSFGVKVEKIVSVQHHPNADRLDIVQVLDWQCITGRDVYKVGDLAVYIPIDAVLPADFEEFLFPAATTKIKLTNSRIKTIKLRGVYSQGMCVNLRDMAEFITAKSGIPTNESRFKLGYDLTATLGITKYEQPLPKDHQAGNPGSPRRKENPHFSKYNHIENAKNLPSFFADGEEVVVTEKIHGTNFRAGYVAYAPTTLWKKLLKFLRLAPQYEFVYGSHNVQLQDKINGGKNGSVYAEAVEKYRLKSLLNHGQVVYGEVYGDGVQKNYSYGCAPGERKLVLFDIKEGGIYSSQARLEAFCDLVGLPHAPVLYRGPFDKEKVRGLTVGSSVLAPEQKVREGVVCRAATGRKLLKFISDAYLMGDTTDFH